MTPAQAEVWALHLEGHSLRTIATMLGRGATSVRSDFHLAKACHEMPEGQRESMEAARLDSATMQGGWIITDKDGEIIKRSTRWTVEKTAEDRQTLVDEISERFAKIEQVKLAPAPKETGAGIAFFPHQDWHFGMVADEATCGQDYNREIAVQRFTSGMMQCFAAIPASETAIILANGDTAHANDDNRETPQSKHKLRVEGTHRQNVTIIIESHAWAIDEALKRHGRVIYRANGGNHDPDVPTPLILALKYRYANEPRVEIDDSESEMWVFQRGNVFIATHHGHKAKPEKMALGIPATYPAKFGAARFWYLFTGHFHNAKSETFGGIKWNQLPALCTLDDYSSSNLFADTSGMTAMWFCEERGRRITFDVSL